MADDIPSVGRFSDAHGTAKASGTSMVFEAVPDGVRPADRLTAAPEPQPDGTRFTSDTARVAARRRWELAKCPDFAKRELEFVPAPIFEPFEPGRRDIIAAKQTELFGMTNCSPSVGVMTTVRGYAWLISFAECWAVEAGKTGDPEHADRARRFFKDASIELAKAHELHRAESAARPVNPADRWRRPVLPEAKK